MKCKKVLPKSALSCAVENLVGTNSEGRNGPFGIGSLRAREKGQLAPTLILAFDCEPARRPYRWNDSPIGCAIILRSHLEVL
jgi:hypothetical protein